MKIFQLMIAAILSVSLLIGPVMERQADAALPFLVFKVIKIAKIAYKAHNKACKASSLAFKAATAGNRAKEAHKIRTGARHVLCRWALNRG